MKKIMILGLLVLIITCTKEANEPKDALDLVPLDNEISGWTRSSALEIAENETQLFALIDGEGQIYVDHGFVKFVRQYYSGSLGEVQLRIIDMEDTTKAKALYDDTGDGSEIAWTDNHAGQEARYKLVTGPAISYYVLDFWDDKFYVYVYIGDGTQAGLDVAKLFGLNISAAINE